MIPQTATAHPGPEHHAATDVVLSWSGGKDSAMALTALRADPTVRVSHLLTTVTGDYERITIHGVRRSLLHAQTVALGMDLIEVTIPADCTHEHYARIMDQALSAPPLKDIDTYAFADLFLEDIRTYRETNLAPLDKTALFPLWGQDTAQLAQRFIDTAWVQGVEATLPC
ncbi:MAG: hypothetical protein ACRDKB_11795 [Actinomycetota bacterium]